MHFHETIVVRHGAVNDQEHEVVVVVELGALAEVLGVLDRKRVKLEHVAQDGVVLLDGLINVDPEEGAAGEKLLDVFAAELGFLASSVVDDRAAVRASPCGRGRGTRRRCWRLVRRPGRGSAGQDGLFR